MPIELIQRKKGKGYRVRVMRDGQKCSATFGRRYDAEQYEVRMKTEGGLLAETNMTFEQAARQWLDNHAKIRKTPSSFATDERILKRNILPALGKLKLNKVTSRHIEGVIVALSESGLKNSSVRRNIDVAKAIFSYFSRRRALTYNPMSGVEPIKLPEVDYRYWTQSEATQFLEYTHQKYAGTKHQVFYLLYKVALHTGMRLGELLALKWSVIDFKSRQIKVCRSYCGTSKVIRETTKSGKIRHVPLGESIYHDLLSAHDRRDSELVFHLHGEILDKSNLRNRHFDKDIKEAEVSRIRIHDMRHTFASHFVMNEGNVYALQAILGHSDIKMTQRYAHLSKGYLSKNANIVSFSNGNVIQGNFGRKEGTNNA